MAKWKIMRLELLKIGAFATEFKFIKSASVEKGV